MHKNNSKEIAKKCYDEWRCSNVAILGRFKTLPVIMKYKHNETLVKIINKECQTAFCAGYDMALKEIVKYLETLPDKTKSQ